MDYPSIPRRGETRWVDYQTDIDPPRNAAVVVSRTAWYRFFHVRASYEARRLVEHDVTGAGFDSASWAALLCSDGSRGPHIISRGVARRRTEGGTTCSCYAQTPHTMRSHYEIEYVGGNGRSRGTQSAIVRLRGPKLRQGLHLATDLFMSFHGRPETSEYIFLNAQWSES